MTNPTDRTGDVVMVAATVLFCRAIAFFYGSRCEMSVAWADLCIANLEFLISCRAFRFSYMGRRMSCHADRELMMVGARTRCSWMAGERSDDTKGAMAGSEGSDAGWRREQRFWRGSDDRRRGVGDSRRRWRRWVSRGGAWALRTRRKGQKQLLVFAFVPLR